MSQKNVIDTANYYNLIARGYENLYKEEQIEKINLTLEFLKFSGIILDLGSGNGVLNKYFLKNKNNFLISSDISFELLKRNLNPNKILVDAQNLPFKDNSFLFVVSFTMLQDVPEPIKVIDEILRICKKGARIILSFLKIAKNKNLILENLENNKKINIIKKIIHHKDFIFVFDKI